METEAKTSVLNDRCGATSTTPRYGAIKECIVW